MVSSEKLNTAQRRKFRIRNKIKESGHVRLSVHRTSKHIYAQLINDNEQGKVLASASSKDKDLQKTLKSGANIDAAKAVGKLVGERAVKNGVKQVVFDRGNFRYHGRIKALADAAREAGLEF